MNALNAKTTSKRPRWLREAREAGRPMLAQHRSRLAHNAINAGVLAIIVVALALTTWASTRLPAPAFVLFGGLAYGLTYYACLAVVVHEASHRMFFLVGNAPRTRTANRVVGWIFSLPFAVHYVRHWEEGHAVHHSRPLEPEDPQRFNVHTGQQLVKTVLLLVLVPGFFLFHRLLQKRPSGHGGSSRNVMVLFVLIWAAVGALTVSTLGWQVLLAQIFGLQVLSALNQLKGALEHGGPIATDPDPLLRSRDAIFAGWPVFWPFFVSIFHFEHHLVPSVPWYELPRFHRALRGVVPQPLHDDVFNRALLRQLAGRIGRIPAEP